MPLFPGLESCDISGSGLLSENRPYSFNIYITKISYFKNIASNFDNIDFHLPAEVEGGWVLNVEYMTWRSSWGVEHWSRGTGLRPAIGTDLAERSWKLIKIYQII